MTPIHFNSVFFNVDCSYHLTMFEHGDWPLAVFTFFVSWDLLCPTWFGSHSLQVNWSSCHLDTAKLSSSFPIQHPTSTPFYCQMDVSRFPSSSPSKNDQVLWKLSKEFACCIFCGQKIIQSTSNFHAGWLQHMGKIPWFLVSRTEVHRCILLPQFVCFLTPSPYGGRGGKVWEMVEKMLP